MRDHYSGPKKPGDWDDPVARSIRSEQNRDAAPTREEAMADHRRHLRSTGCKNCDENDPDNLGNYTIKEPPCPGVQPHPDPFVVLCEDCADDRETLRERAVRKATARAEAGRHDTVAVALYECGSFEYVEKPEYDGSYPTRHGGHPIPQVSIRCPRCGESALDGVVEV